MNESSLLWGMLFGSIGLGYFVYGKKQRAVSPLVCGLSLMIYPWFVTSTFWLVVVGLCLSIIPWVARF